MDDRLITEEMERALLFPPLSFYGETRAAVCLRPAQYVDRAFSNSFTEANGLFFLSRRFGFFVHLGAKRPKLKAFQHSGGQQLQFLGGFIKRSLQVELCFYTQ